MHPRDRPFVDAPAGPADELDAVAIAASEQFGIGPVARLRIGMNGVFAARDAVIRVSRPSTEPSVAIELARNLRDAGVRVPRPLSDRVVEVGPYRATSWERVQPNGEPIDWRAVGRSIARLHRTGRGLVPLGHPLPSPTVFAWWDLGRLLEENRDALDDAAVAGLADAIARHADWASAVGHDAVVCHGDVHPGNVVMTDEGPVLLDWDLLCEATPAWDHAPMLTMAGRWGGAPGEYEAYAEGYGRSFRDDATGAALAELRLVAATLMRVAAARTDPAAAHELERRLRFWRADPDAPAWHAQ